MTPSFLEPRLLLVVLIALLAGCDRPEGVRGRGCSLNTDCTEPLICGLARCRRQCLSSRDCPAGLRCLRLVSQQQGGACQLEEERACTLTSDCTLGLVCLFGTCTTACAEDRDCTRGAICQAVDGGAPACDEPTAELCVYNSDCPAPFVCGPDQVCQPECREDRDCPVPRRCARSPTEAVGRCELPDAGR